VTIRFLEIAEAELDQAVRWYETQTPGLGEAFLIDILAAADRVALYPDAWQPLGNNLHRCRLSRFPYGLIYAVDGTDILVLAVAHLHREPDYWRDRHQQSRP
jgi:toxin ParE2